MFPLRCADFASADILAAILRGAAMDGKPSVKASLKSIFKRHDKEGTSAKPNDIIPILKQELQKLEVLKSSAGLTARQTEKYTKLRQALDLLEDEGLARQPSGSDWQRAHRACKAALG